MTLKTRKLWQSDIGKEKTHILLIQRHTHTHTAHTQHTAHTLPHTPTRAPRGTSSCTIINGCDRHTPSRFTCRGGGERGGTRLLSKRTILHCSTDTCFPCSSLVIINTPNPHHATCKHTHTHTHTHTYTPITKPTPHTTHKPTPTTHHVRVLEARHEVGLAQELVAAPHGLGPQRLHGNLDGLVVGTERDWA
jgi:hypothetical protein